MTRISRHRALVFQAKEKTKVLVRPELNFFQFFLPRAGFDLRTRLRNPKTRLRSDPSTSALSRFSTVVTPISCQIFPHDFHYLLHANWRFPDFIISKFYLHFWGGGTCCRFVVFTVVLRPNLAFWKTLWGFNLLGKFSKAVLMWFYYDLFNSSSQI